MGVFKRKEMTFSVGVGRSYIYRLTTRKYSAFSQQKLFLPEIIMLNNWSQICDNVTVCICYGFILIKLMAYLTSKLIGQLYILQNTFFPWKRRFPEVKRSTYGDNQMRSGKKCWKIMRSVKYRLYSQYQKYLRNLFNEFTARKIAG